MIGFCCLLLLLSNLKQCLIFHRHCYLKLTCGDLYLQKKADDARTPISYSDAVLEDEKVLWIVCDQKSSLEHPIPPIFASAFTAFSGGFKTGPSPVDRRAVGGGPSESCHVGQLLDVSDAPWTCIDVNTNATCIPTLHACRQSKRLFADSLGARLRGDH